MFSYLQAIIIGSLQGITELFPISSLGHSVLLESFLNWNLRQDNPYFLTFLVATHTATALVLFIFFWRDWLRIIKGLIRSFISRSIADTDTDAKLGWLLVVGTIPAGILGLLFEETFKKFFSAPQLVAVLLIFNGLMLLGAEYLRRQSVGNHTKNSQPHISKLSWLQAIKIGLFQCLALLPGFSRTGSTITAGLLMGLNHEDAARFSFLLATPIIAAASLLKIPELATTGAQLVLGPTLVGAACAGITAYFSVRFLEKYFKTDKLTPFAFYCIIAGVVTTIIFLLR